MKKWLIFGLSLVLVLAMTACAAKSEETIPETTGVQSTVPHSADPTVPEVTDPTQPAVTDPTVPDVTDPEEIELVFDMANYQWLYNPFENETVEEWNAMGRYTLRLEGLHTPVVLNMDGTSVLSISAFDQTVDLGTDGMADDYHDGYSPVQSIRSTQDAVVIHVSFGEMGDGSILITNGRYFKYPEKDGGSIFLWIKADGTLGYRQTWVYADDIEEQGYYALTWLTARDQVLHQNGGAEIVEGELVLTAEETVALSDLYDLDAMFAEGKAAGMFTEYEAVDQLFEANKTRE